MQRLNKLDSNIGQKLQRAMSLAGTCIVAAGMMAASPVLADEFAPRSAARSVHELNLMLHSTESRCASTNNEFAIAYGRLTNERGFVLSEAESEFRDELERRHGPTVAQNMLRDMEKAAAHASSGDCRTWAQATQSLLKAGNSAALIATAERIVRNGPAPEMALAQR